MISQICEAFSIPPSVAMRQDYRLCQNIMLMRRFAQLFGQMHQDKTKLSAADWDFMEWMEGLSQS